MPSRLQFLTQYQGGTEQTPTKTQRMGWSSVEVDLATRSPDEFTMVAEDLERDSGLAPDGNPHIYHDGEAYWCDVNLVNRVRGMAQGGLWSHGKYWWGAKEEGLGRFQPLQQRRFFWNTFGFSLFARPPARTFLAADPRKISNHRPKGELDWDETPGISAIFAKYAVENLCLVDGNVMCRIEKPYLRRTFGYLYLDVTKQTGCPGGDVLTPFGCLGDPLVDFVELERENASRSQEARVMWRWLASESERAELDRNARDPAARTALAVYMDIFHQRSWANWKTRAKHATAFDELTRLWKENGTRFEEDHVDAVASVLLGVAAPVDVRKLLDVWEDRVISI